VAATDADAIARAAGGSSLSVSRGVDAMPERYRRPS
jgi:hypothetical protein